MKKVITKLSVVFTAGCVGGVVNSLFVWGFGAFGISQSFGVQLAPPFTPAWVYPHTVWGGYWGVLFLLPVLKRSVWLRGFLFSLLPSLMMFFLVFPISADAGIWGLKLGKTTPILVIFFNFIWGLAAALWVKPTEKSILEEVK